MNLTPLQLVGQYAPMSTHTLKDQAHAVVLEPNTPPVGCVLWLHGLGANGYDFVDVVPQLGLAADVPLRFVFPHAPSQPVTANAGMVMPAWYDIYSLETLDKEDTEGIQVIAARVHEWVAEQVQQGLPVVLMGFSQGGGSGFVLRVDLPA